MQKIPLPAGFSDIGPDEIPKWAFAEATVRRVFNSYGFSELRTPFLEDTAVFSRGIGEHTDIVEKEMYTFGTKDDTVSLRPEGTAPVIRSYIENGQDKFNTFQKYWYMGPMFRHEKPQKGRKRQFAQMGVEILGTSLPSADAETIILAQRLLQELNVKGFSLEVNTTGCGQCRPQYKDALKDALKDKVTDLCPHCQKRYETNIFRMLDCKNGECRELFEDLPDILAYICPECREHHDAVKGYLFDMKIEFEENRFLVRGLDYYTKTVYEITHPDLGAQDALLGGGRYDDLVEEMGGQPQAAVGFAAGMDRIIAVMGELKEKERREGIFLVTVGENAYQKGFSLVQELRDNGIKADIDYEGKSLKAQMKGVDKRNFRIAAILGEDELEKGVVSFKDMEEGSQIDIKLDEFVGKISKLLKEVDERIEQELQDG
jgi:histidyl-tRNA synthetase